MTALQQRARALETQYVLEQERQFKADARRAKMIGRWAGYTMGIDDVEAYAQTIAATQLVEPHRLLERLNRDFVTAGISIRPTELASRMEHYLERAAAELSAQA